MKQFINKTLATIITIVLMGANLLLLGTEVIAYGGELENQKNNTNNSNVEFNSYFDEQVHGKAFSTTDMAKLYLKFKIKNAGYLEHVIVNFSNANFEIDSDNLKMDYIEKVNDQKNTLTLKQINKGQELIIEVPVKMLNKEIITSDHFNKVSETILSANYIDQDGNKKSISKTIKNQLEWHGTAEVENNSKTSKYVPYHIGEEYGVLLQTVIENKVKDSVLPIKEEITQIEVPVINELKPEEVKVIANNTKASNGQEDGIYFNQENYEYNQESGKVQIKVNNNINDQNQINWKKNTTDEYIVTYIYKGKEIYDYVQKEEVKGIFKLNVQMSLYNNEETIINKDFSYEYTLKEIMGDINDVELLTEKQMSKGYLYANYDKKNGKEETVFKEAYTVTIPYAGVINEMQIEQETNKWEQTDGTQLNTTVSKNNSIYNKNIKIAENIFKKILGEDGKIEILKKDKTKIGEINKGTQKDDEGNYVYDLAKENNDELIFKISKPILEGKLVIEVEQAIKGDINYTKEQFKNIDTLNKEIILKTNIKEETKTEKIQMKEPISKAILTINRTDLSTMVKNENVELRAVLDTSSTYNALYKNPVIEIELPEYVDSIDIKSSKMLFEEELKVKEATLIEKNGKKVIRIALEGTQTKYNTNNKEITGATIVIGADITLNRLTPRKTSEIVMYYTNENTKLYENDNKGIKNVLKARSVQNDTEIKGIANASVRFVVPTGVLTTSGVSGYKEGADEIISISDEIKDVEISPFVDKRTATVKGTVTNNYENTISNVSILGRLPFKGNKKIDTTEDLKSTMDLKLTKAITLVGMDTSKVDVYYSENGEADKDVSKTANGWTKTPTDFSKVKSYLIVLKEKVAAGASIGFNYDIEIPQNLTHNQDISETYKTYYTNDSSVASMTEAKVAPILKFTTGKGPELEIKLTSNIENNSKVFTGQYVRFYLEIKNTGELEAKNAKIKVDLPKHAKFAIFDEGNAAYNLSEDGDNIYNINLGTIKPGQTVKESYEICCMENTEGSDEETDGDAPEEAVIKTLAQLTADNINGAMKSNEYTFTFIQGRYSFINATNTTELMTYKQGDLIEYTAKIANQTKEDITNAVINIPIPEGTTNKEVSIQKQNGEIIKDGIDIQSNKIVINLGKLEAGSKLTIITKYTLGNTYPDTISTQMTLTGDNIKLTSNERFIYTGKVTLLAEQIKPTNQYVKERETFTYQFKVVSNGTASINNFVLEDTLATEISFVSADVYSIDAENRKESVEHVVEQKDGKVYIKIPTIEKGTTIKIYLYVKGNLSSKNDDGKAIVNKAKVSARNVEEITLNEVTHYLEYKAPADINDNEDDEKGYKISGTAWIDSNKDGKKEDDEATLSNVKVILLYKDNNQVVQDSVTKLNKITTTNDNGYYEFKNLKSNKYLVMFVYDNSRYTITTYQQNGVEESINSDAIGMDVILDGKKTKVGMTNTINLTSTNIRYIDIGLYGDEKFDLKLDKYITKISRTTPTSGTQQFTYDNATIKKMEILKQNVDKSNLVIEYKIVITNEGAIPGYVKKIVDYLPEGVNFSTDLNKDWYTSKDNGNVYNASLANTKLNPGESKEVTLILTKKITEDSIGSIIQNVAEIYEASNELGIPDIDSEPGNKLESEDDIGKADIILSLVTGKIIMYSSIFLVALGIVIVGIIIIKKKVLNKNK